MRMYVYIYIYIYTWHKYEYVSKWTDISSLVGILLSIPHCQWISKKWDGEWSNDQSLQSPQSWSWGLRTFGLLDFCQWNFAGNGMESDYIIVWWIWLTFTVLPVSPRQTLASRQLRQPSISAQEPDCWSVHPRRRPQRIEAWAMQKGCTSKSSCWSHFCPLMYSAMWFVMSTTIIKTGEWGKQQRFVYCLYTFKRRGNAMIASRRPTWRSIAKYERHNSLKILKDGRARKQRTTHRMVAMTFYQNILKALKPMIIVTWC